MKIKNKGFTLIELMVTVAIIGILGAVALPAYQDYTIRSQVTEGLSLASGAKVQVAEYYANHGAFPEEMNDLGMVSSQGSFISATALGERGTILATFGNNANKNILGGMVSLIPEETSKGNLEWTCEANIEEKYLPTSCKQNEIEPTIPGETEVPPVVETPHRDPIYTVREDGSRLYPNGMITSERGVIDINSLNMGNIASMLTNHRYSTNGVPRYVTLTELINSHNQWINSGHNKNNDLQNVDLSAGYILTQVKWLIDNNFNGVAPSNMPFVRSNGTVMEWDSVLNEYY